MTRNKSTAHLQSSDKISTGRNYEGATPSSKSPRKLSSSIYSMIYYFPQKHKDQTRGFHSWLSAYYYDYH